MKFKSSLSRVVAQQLGALEGQIKAYAVSTLSDIVETKLNGITCPPQAEVLSIIRTLNSIQNILTKYQRQSQRYSSLIAKLDRVIESTTLAVRVLRTLPTPTAVGGVGVPLGLTNRYSEKLGDLSDFLDKLQNDKQAILTIVNTSNVDLTRVQGIVNTAKSRADKCLAGSNSQSLNAELKASNDSLVGADRATYTLSNGRQVKVDIRTISDPSYPINRRYAEAKNLDGLVLLTGEPSYSSNTDILIEEVLFKLENQLV